MVVYECRYCLRVFKSKHGRASHQRQSTYCQEMQRSEEEGPNADPDSTPKANEKGGEDDQSWWHLKQQPAVNTSEPWRPSKLRKLLGPFSMNRLLMSAKGDSKRLREALLELQTSKIDPKQQDQVYRTLNMLLARGNSQFKRELIIDEEKGGGEEGFSWRDDQDYDEERIDAEDLEDDNSQKELTGEEVAEEAGGAEPEEREKRRRECFQDFRNYVEFAQKNLLELSEIERASVRLMHKLIKKKAPLDTYDDVMEWHLQETGHLGPNESAGQCPLFMSRAKLMQKLRERYYMSFQYATSCTISLPHSKSKVVVWKKNARDNVLSLLTDPRWDNEDWLYFDDDPFAAPPENLPYVADLNTGEAYLETYKQLITKERQILVAVPLYIDGAVTGQFDKLQVTALKMSIGLLNRRARDREHAWRNLGFVTNYTEEDTHGRKLFVESGHVSALERYCKESQGQGQDEEEEDGEGEESVDKAADYHAILEVLLQSLKDLIAEGMVVDINYKGKIYKECELVFFVPFVKCDGDEGDKLALSYRSRGPHVQQLCRYCQCPTDKTDDPHANFPYKTEPMMRDLFDKKNAKRLREMSQICAKNAFHGLRFGMHNDRGIHGACPWELLHAVLLGIFKYVRDCLFEQVGETSATAQELNSLAQEIGSLLSRQSDRNKPRTKFAKGILKGKLMAKEYTGVLLVIAAVLQCEKGRELLSGARRKGFRVAGQISDWVLLVETLLQWEAYLNLEQMERKHVTKLKTKHRYLLYLLKRVANRQDGMGFKVVKFHAILHLAEDILMYGVPMNVDTGSNESHHKITKIAAKLTQKDARTFERQTSDRLDDFHVLNLAMEEIRGRKLWEYLKPFIEEHESDGDGDGEDVKPITTVGGMKITTSLDPDTHSVQFSVATKMKNPEEVMLDVQFLEFVHRIEQDIGHVAGKIAVFAEHQRSSVMFRAHPEFRGKGLWRDWVMIEWQSGDYPAQIWGFLDLTNLPRGQSFRLFDGTNVTKGFWAIVESCFYKKTDPAMPSSELFQHLVLETNENNDDGSVRRRKFYVVDVETFKFPIVVIPNIGTKRDYIMMNPRDNWPDDFLKWLSAPHIADKQQMHAP